MSNYALDFRPKTLDEMYGLDFRFKNYFRHEAKTNYKDVKGIVFQGKFGSGKTTAASIAAKMIVCQHPLPNGDPCNECLECKAVNDNLFNKSVKLFQAETSGKGDLLEQLETLDTRTMYGKQKVIIIDEFQELSTEAKNVFLHKLEELDKPNIHWIFTSMAYLPPSGILSRCKQFKFKEPTPEQVAEFLFKFVTEKSDEDGLILEQLHSFLKPEQIQDYLLKIAYQGDGSYRSALQNLEVAVKSKTTEVVSEVDVAILPAEFIMLLVDAKNAALNKDILYKISRQFQAWNDADDNCSGVLALVKYVYAAYFALLTGNTDADPTIAKSYLDGLCQNIKKTASSYKAFMELAAVFLKLDYQTMVYNFNIMPKVKYQQTFMLIMKDYFKLA